MLTENEWLVFTFTLWPLQAQYLKKELFKGRNSQLQDPSYHQLETGPQNRAKIKTMAITLKIHIKEGVIERGIVQYIANNKYPTLFHSQFRRLLRQ